MDTDVGGRMAGQTPDKQGNNRDGFVAVVRLTLLKHSPISGLDQVEEQSGINAPPGSGSVPCGTANVD
jgi:hypothetical protein